VTGGLFTSGREKLDPFGSSPGQVDGDMGGCESHARRYSRRRPGGCLGGTSDTLYTGHAGAGAGRIREPENHFRVPVSMVAPEWAASAAGTLSKFLSKNFSGVRASEAIRASAGFISSRCG